MNRVILMGRLARDPDVRHSQDGDSGKDYARYTLAVDRPQGRQAQGSSSEPTADFIGCVAFGKGAGFVEQYLHKGTKILMNSPLPCKCYGSGFFQGTNAC